MRAAVALLLVAGCSFRPSGASVVGDAGDDDAAGDAQPVGSGSGTPTCGIPGSLQDDFSDTALAKWNVVVKSNGTVMAMPANVLTLKVTNDSGSSAGVVSKHAVDMTGGAIEVAVPMVLGGAGSTGFIVGFDYAHFFGFVLKSNMLTTEELDGATSSAQMVAFDPKMMKQWRFREAGGMVYFETSPDGVTWTPRDSPLPTPSWITDMFVSMIATGASGMAQFANLDTGLTTAPWCPIDTLHDAFTGSNFQWGGEVQSTACAYAVGSGASVTTLALIATCYLGSSRAYALTGDSVVVGWQSTTTPSATYEPFVAVAGDTGRFVVAIESGFVCYPNATTCSTVYPFDPSSHDKFWKITESSGTLTFASGSDGTTWTPFATGSAGFSTDTTELELGEVSDGEVGTATFTSVN